jgi:hypothetical protein
MELKAYRMKSKKKVKQTMKNFEAGVGIKLSNP